MGYWTYRVVKKYFPETDKHLFTVHEAHYYDDGHYAVSYTHLDVYKRQDYAHATVVINQNG